MNCKIAIDMCYYGRIHLGGKDEAAYNLLRGFEEIGVSDQIVCFVYREMTEKISFISPNINICVVPKININRFINYVRMWLRSFYEERYARKNNVKLLIMPLKPTANRRLSIKTMEIPHDISIFENIHATDDTDRQIRRMKKRITNDFENRDHIVAISDYDEEEMIKFFPWAKGKIVRLYDPIRFGKCVSNGSKRYITALNIQWEHKNTATLIKAFSLIASSIEYDLILVGRHPDNVESLTKLVRDNDLESRVFFAGFVSDEELDSIIEKTRVFVNASLFEGFGMTAIEMMGRKVPTIVAENTAQPEVTMGLCRYYYPAEDHMALAEEIMNEIKEPTSDRELENIAQAVRGKYSCEIIAREYWDFIKSVLEERET